MTNAPAFKEMSDDIDERARFCADLIREAGEMARQGFSAQSARQLKLKGPQDYLTETGLAEDAVNPDTFVRWTYAKALAHRQPRYEAMAQRWGVTVTADEVGALKGEADFIDLIATALERRG